MKIAIAAILGTIGGPRTYACNLIKGISRIDRENEYIIFTDNTDGLNDVNGVSKIHIGSYAPYSRLFWDHLKVPFYLKKYGIDLYHNTKNALPLFAHTKADVVTIHDMAPFLFPESFTPMQRTHLKFHYRHAAKSAKKVVTVSEQSRKDIINILGTEEKKVVSIPNGVSDEFCKMGDAGVLEEFRVKYGLTKNVILCVSTLQPRKNVDVAIKAFSALKKQKKVPHQLVIVGRRGWLWKDIMGLATELNLQHTVIAMGDAPKQSQDRLLRFARNDKMDVIFTGAVEDDKLPLFYNIADVFVNPSSYEGFGLTCLEAMACGAPVITTNVSAFPEVVGDAGIMVTPKSVEELTHVLSNILFNDHFRSELVEKGLERAKMFSWTKAAEKTVSVYKEVLQ